ncbi:MAG: DUF4430 domain-containing protein [Dehalobacterium sp.]
MKKISLWGLLLLMFMVVFAVAACASRETKNASGETDQKQTVTEEPSSEVNGDTGEEYSEPPAESGQIEENPDDDKKEVSVLNSNETGKEKKEQVSQDQKAGGASAPLKEPETVRQVALKVTRDFGTQVIFNKKVEIKNNQTIMELLEANLDIETDWDGGFIKGINGLISDKGGLSGKRTDWFYYVNGICSDVGADGYAPAPGETIWWDYHLWQSMGSAISAVIGCYPEPFIHGYEGKIGATTIMSTQEKSALAEKLKQALTDQGVKTVNLSGLDEGKLAKRTGPVIALGEWQELNQVKWLEDFNKAYRKTGTGVHFTDPEAELVKYNGELDQAVSGSVGVIVATGSGLGDESPLWLVAGTDEKGLEQAINVLVNTPEKINGLYSAAIVNGEIVCLPIQDKE